MTPLGEIKQLSDCSLTHTLLTYWRKLLGAPSLPGEPSSSSEAKGEEGGSEAQIARSAR
jgi:hypothetical protein